MVNTIAIFICLYELCNIENISNNNECCSNMKIIF